jgi:co-chaperonin GroES (HSP10)
MPAAKLMSIAQSSDPKRGIIDAVGDLSNVCVLSGRVLVGIYIAPEKTVGGIIRPNSNVKEDVYQGQVGLVLKKGLMAFKDDDQNKFHGQDVQVGDWVVFRPGDGKRVQIRGVDCRLIDDVLIDMVVESPALITHAK